MKITEKDIRQMIKEELQSLKESQNFEEWPEELQQVFEEKWEDAVYSHRQTWEKVLYNSIIANKNSFERYIKGNSNLGTLDKYYNYQFKDPVKRIVTNITFELFDEYEKKKMYKESDILSNIWMGAIDYYKNTEEGREITDYLYNLAKFAWMVGTNEVPDGISEEQREYLSKIIEMAKGDPELMVSAYGLYETMFLD